MYVQTLEHMFLEACTRAEMDGGGGGGANWHKALAMLLLFLSHLERQVGLHCVWGQRVSDDAVRATGLD